MLLRVVIGLGLALMLLGFGAAGVQYLRLGADPETAVARTPASEAGSGAAAVTQTWLISPAGGAVPQAEARAYLAQDRFVESRIATVTRTALLTELLQDGERLPDAPYLQVLADIRAPLVAGRLCDALLVSIAAGCAVHHARVVDGSIDRAAGKARFKVDLAYRLKPSDEALPDLAAHVLMSDTIGREFAAGAEGAGMPEELLGSAADAAVAACGALKGGKSCRVTGLDVTWFDNGSGAVRARIGWLAPLPQGIVTAPPLGVPGG